VTIEVIDAGSSATVATFAGAGASGDNSVAWDGTANSAGGTEVAVGSYRVKITANKTVAGTAWVEFASNRSQGQYGPAATLETLFQGYSGKDLLIQTDPESDLFGLLLASSSYGTPAHYGVVVFKPDLNTYDGGDGLNTVLNHPGGTLNNQATWGSDWDPEAINGSWIAGQGFPNILYAANATVLDTTLTNKDPLGEFVLIDYPRSIAVSIEDGTKVLYLPAGNELVTRVELDGNDDVAAGTRKDIIGDLGGAAEAHYGKDVEIASNGDLFYATRRGASDGTGGKVVRIPVATAKAGNDDIVEAGCSWVIAAAAGDTDLKGVTIDQDGDVYTATGQGIYLIDNVSASSVTKQLGASDKVVDFAAMSWTPSGFGTNLAADYAGNIYVTDTGNEQVRAFEAPGSSSLAVTAPSSQTFQVVTITGLKSWNDYR